MFKSRTIAAGAAVMAVFLLTACGAGKEPEKPAEEVLNEGISNLYSEVSSASYKFDFTVDAEMPDQDPAKVAFDMSLEGAMDQSDPKMPKMTLKMSGNAATGDDAKESVTGEVRVNEGMAYLMLSAVPSLGGQVPPDLVAPFVGKWFSVAIPDGSLDQVAMLKPGKELTEEQQKLKDLLMDANLFGELKFEGTEDVMGDSAYHYSGKLDKAAVIEFVKNGSMEIDGSEPSEADLAELENLLDGVSFDADIWVGVDDMIMRKIAGDLTVNQPDGAGTVKMNVNFELGDINKAVSVEVPADAQSLEETIQGMMGGM